MKIQNAYPSLFILLLCLSFSSMQGQSADYAPGRVLIKFKEGKSRTQRNTLRNQMRGKVLKTYSQLKIELWNVGSPQDKTSIPTLIKQYENHPDIEFIEPDYVVTGTETTPDDNGFGLQWGLNNIGLANGTPDADIDAPEAWDIATESPDMAVAVLDSGIDWDNIDLIDNIWNNLGEDADGDGSVLEWNGTTWVFDPGDQNNIDDDNNGYIDDFVGWDFWNNDNNPVDDTLHGTFCSGIIGAKGNNGAGIAGVTWNVQLVALKTLNQNVQGFTSDSVEALNYAIAMGIPISNHSYSSSTFSSTFVQAIQNAEANGHLIFAAAGNAAVDNDITPRYPAAYPADNIITVAATNRNDGLAVFSNFGLTTVDIAAPGQAIFSVGLNDNYSTRSGTSFSTPLVAGACALLWGQHPTKSAAEIKEALLNSTDKIPSLSGKCVSEGRLNLFNALTYFTTEPVTCRSSDSLALVAFYNSTGGDSWTTSWNLNQPMDSWYGVNLNEEGCVSCLDMNGNPNCADDNNSSGNGLTGTLPAEIGDLSNLTFLDLSFNNLSGVVPSAISALDKLTFLSLGSNNLSGTIPIQIGNLDQLTHLDLSDNDVTNMPSQIGNLTNLEFLDLSTNLISGTIPTTIGSLNKLDNLALNNNQLSGQIPAVLGNLNSLSTLNLANNQLSGCYAENVSGLCNQLSANSNTNTAISLGNNFDAPWEDFCASNAGVCDGTISCRSRDSLALVALYNSTGGIGWTNNWNLNQPMDSWYGIGLNDNGCVSCIDMDNIVDCIQGVNAVGNGLVGTLPPELGDLSELTFLNLISNNLSGAIPPEIGNLRLLTFLTLADNNLSGAIPEEIGNLDNLASLTLSTNQLTSIPDQIGNLSNLESLNLTFNKIGGPIPTTLGNLNKLKILSLNRNQLTGSIPIELTNSAALKIVKLADNQLSGCYDDDLSELCSQLFPFANTNTNISDNNNFDAPWEDFCTSGIGACGAVLSCRSTDSLALVALYDATDGTNWTTSWNLNQPMDSWYGIQLNENGCVSCIDMDGNADCINRFSSAGNNLVGTIPTEIGDLTELTFVNFASNNLSGSIPMEIGNLGLLNYLNLADNKLSGPIPAQIGNLEKLVTLNMAINQLTELPDQIGNLSLLEFMNLTLNDISGPIPTSIGNLSQLRTLLLNLNQFSGHIPLELGNLTQLITLNLGTNQLTGCYDDNLSGLCSQLNSWSSANSYISNGNNFDASWEDFCSSSAGTCGIALSCRSVDSLALVALYNSTDGTNWTTSWDLNQAMDSWFGISLNENGCVSCIDMDGTVDCTKQFSSAGNGLTGTLPTELGDLSELTFLNLSFNELSGSIPAEIGNLGLLTYLNLSSNNLSGPIPTQIGNLENLITLTISSNQLTTLPEQIGNLTMLDYLNLTNNSISGIIPASIGNLSQLESLFLNLNQLSGSLPPELGNMPSLTALNTANNQLNGCYEENLSGLCNQLNAWSSTNTYISNGNNFDAPWEDFCNSGAGTCGIIVDGSDMWPSDFNFDGISNNIDLLYWGLAENNTGPIRPNASTNWTAQASPDWSTTVNGINSKHQDADGNGIVNSQDIQVLINNYGNSHEINDSLNTLHTVDFHLEVVGSSTEGDTTTLEYALYANQDGAPADIHGAACTIIFNDFDLITASLDVTDSSLEPDEQLIVFNGNSIDIALTRTDKSNKICIGPIATIIVTIETEDLPSSDRFRLSIEASKMSKADETILSGSNYSFYDIYTEDGANDFNMLLTGSVTHIQCLSAGSAEVSIAGGVGNYRIEWSTGDTTAQINELSPGSYTVTVSDGNGLTKSLTLEVLYQSQPIYNESGNLVSCNAFECPTVIDFIGNLPNGTHQAGKAINSNAQVISGYTSVFKAGFVINLLPGFTVQPGSTFSLEMEGCEN